jgi:hypothetical protein
MALEFDEPGGGSDVGVGVQVNDAHGRATCDG